MKYLLQFLETPPDDPPDFFTGTSAEVPTKPTKPPPAFLADRWGPGLDDDHPGLVVPFLPPRVADVAAMPLALELAAWLDSGLTAADLSLLPALPPRPPGTPTHGLTARGHVVELPRRPAADAADPVALVTAPGWPGWYPSPRPRPPADDLVAYQELARPNAGPPTPPVPKSPWIVQARNH